MAPCLELTRFPLNGHQCLEKQGLCFYHAFCSSFVVCFDLPDCHHSGKKKYSRLSTENAQKIEYGESTECLNIFSVMPIRLCTKQHRKQLRNFGTFGGTECLRKLLTRNVLYIFLCFFPRSAGVVKPTRTGHHTTSRSSRRA